VPEFPWVEHEHVRFRDCDATGHVNNAVHSTYLDYAQDASVPITDDVKRRLTA